MSITIVTDHRQEYPGLALSRRVFSFLERKELPRTGYAGNVITTWMLRAEHALRKRAASTSSALPSRRIPYR